MAVETEKKELIKLERALGSLNITEGGFSLQF